MKQWREDGEEQTEGVVMVMVRYLIVITLSIIPLFSFFTRSQQHHYFANGGGGGVSE